MNIKVLKILKRGGWSPLCSFGPFLIYRTNRGYEYQGPQNAGEGWSLLCSFEPFLIYRTNTEYEYQGSPLCSFGPFLIYRTNPEYEYQGPHNAEERGLVSFMQFWSFFNI